MRIRLDFPSGSKVYTYTWEKGGKILVRVRCDQISVRKVGKS